MKNRLHPLLLLSILLSFCIADAAKVRALSLKVLQQQLTQKRSYHKLHRMTGISRIIGYITDIKNRDIILIGKPGTPSLHTEDFVVALRNTYLIYARKKKHTKYYTAPGCSIDPDSVVIIRLRKAAESLFASRSGKDVHKREKHWRTVCSSPQNVRVLGIPYHCRFAATMVKADYDMKRLVDGTDRLDIPGFDNLNDLTISQTREQFLAFEDITAGMRMNRFWFYPGDVKYAEESSAILIKKCQVILLTEEQFVNVTGSHYGRGTPDPLAEKFANLFTDYYDEIAKQRPIYTDLENLFRFFALTKAIRYNESLSKAGIDQNFWLKDYVIPHTKVATILPGRSSYTTEEFHREIEGGHQTLRIQLPTCGGVSMDFEIDKKNFTPLKKKRTKAISKAIKSRPNKDTLTWDFEMDLEGF